MILRVMILLSALAFSTAVLGTVRAAPRAQVPTIYVEPSRGSIQDWFVFTGEGFQPGARVWVIFFAPDGQIWDLVDNPLVTAEDGTFRLPILPEQDLALVAGSPATVQLGFWIARFALDEETWWEQTFVVLP
jgi:hypothetical protein